MRIAYKVKRELFSSKDREKRAEFSKVDVFQLTHISETRQARQQLLVA